MDVSTRSTAGTADGAAAMPALAPPAGAAPADLVLERLDDQLRWYDAKAASHKRGYQLLKLLQIVIAAAIPVIAALEGSAAAAGVLGAVIVVLEAVQQLFQFQQNWISYRTTAESLKHEKYLYLAGAGHYETAQRPHARLAETVEALVSQETTTWASVQTQAARGEQP